MTNKNKKIQTILISLLLLAVSIYIATSRLVTRDEGFYLIAAKEVMAGKLPYIDFFYPQTPLYPYIFGLWLKLTNFTWVSARILAALITTITGILSFEIIRRRYNAFTASLGVVLFIFCSLTTAWLLTAKTYGISALFLVLLYLILQRKNSLEKSNLLIAGVLVGLLFNVRSYLVIIGIIPTILIFANSKDLNTAFKNFFCLALGAFITLLPHLIFIAQGLDQYTFNNIGYHLIRSDRSAAQLLAGKFKIAEFLIGFEPTIKASGYQVPFLVWSWAILLIISLARKKIPSLAWFFSAVLFIINFLPSPTWLQYFSVAIPFLIICLLELLSIFPKRFKLAFLLLAIIYFTTTGVQDLTNYAETGDGVHGIYETNLEASRLSKISEISNKINELSSPGEIVVSVWPGYLLESHAKSFSGMENQFWIRVGHKLSRPEAIKYKVMTLDFLQEVIQSKQVKLVVVDLHKAGRFFPKNILKKSGYKELLNLHNVLFFKRP